MGCFLVAGEGLEPSASRLWAWRAAIAPPRGINLLGRGYTNIHGHFVNHLFENGGTLSVPITTLSVVPGDGIEPSTLGL